MLGFGELGSLEHGSGQTSNRAGPTVRIGVQDHLEWQAAYLWGKTYGDRGDMFTSQLLWKF